MPVLRQRVWWGGRGFINKQLPLLESGGESHTWATSSAGLALSGSITDCGRVKRHWDLDGLGLINVLSLLVVPL